MFSPNPTIYYYAIWNNNYYLNLQFDLFLIQTERQHDGRNDVDQEENGLDVENDDDRGDQDNGDGDSVDMGRPRKIRR